MQELETVLIKLADTQGNHEERIAALETSLRQMKKVLVIAFKIAGFNFEQALKMAELAEDSQALVPAQPVRTHDEIRALINLASKGNRVE